MNQINLQTHPSHKGKHHVDLAGQTAQHLTAEQHQRDGQRDIYHPLHEQREASAQSVFERDAGIGGEGKEQQDEPERRTLVAPTLTDRLPHVDADEEDGDAAPKDFDMADGMMERCHILHHHTEHHRHHGKPAPQLLATDEVHVGRGKRVHHHDGGDEPELPGITLPETPVDADVGHQLPQVGALTAVGHVVGEVEIARHQQPDGIDAQVAAQEEMLQTAVAAE